MQRLLTFFVSIFLCVSAVHAGLPTGDIDSKVQADSERGGVEKAMQLWINAVADKKTGGIDSLLDAKSADFYLRIKYMALRASVQELSDLSEVDQLQVMFFRSMIEADELREMTAQQLIAFAVKKGFIGMELRRSDVLQEITIDGDTAQGRLFKFGRSDRPDPYLQYFVKEQGVWRVSLQGERERLEGVFETFVVRSKLQRSEAAFLILEMRLMRKFTPTDFDAQYASGDSREVTYRTQSIPAAASIDVEKRYRLVSLRLPESVIGRPAVTLDDFVSGLKYVLGPGQAMPANPEFTLHRVTANEAIFRKNDNSANTVTLRLNTGHRLQRTSNVIESGAAGLSSLLDLAVMGEKYEGQMMMQWRNIGLRGRPQLLQQGWLTPDFGGAVGPGKSMLGLRVREVMPASFWDQMGLQPGDLLTAVNGATIDSLDAWKKVIEIAQSQQELTVRLERDNNELSFRTVTVKPG